MAFKVRGHICIRRKAKDGTNGQSSFKSIVFIRTNDTPSTPTGGSYTTPVPTGWSDGVPSGTAKLWMSTRIFTSDGLPPQQSVWTTPQQATDTADIDFEFSAVTTSPGNPTSNPGNWHNTATENDIWMAVRKKQNGVWGSWEIAKIKGEDGKDGKDGKDGGDGQSTFKSIVFKRQSNTPSTPTGGSYASPVPTGWSDGVPTGTTQLWMSTRIFTSDEKSPQQNAWTTPQTVSDDIDIDFEFSAVATNPGTPTSNPSNWHNTATENDIWMAVRKYKNGTWGSWEISKIKGEDGRDGTNGTNGTNGAPGRTIRTTVWVPGKQYYCGDTQVDGVYPLDIVSDKAISIGESGVNFYMCKNSHTSSSNIPLTNTTYWTKLNSLKPIVTYLILAEAIKANFIDVADLAANTAFINSLYVKHLNGADGSFSGSLAAREGFFGQLHIDSTGISIESDDSQDDYQSGHLSFSGLSFFDDDLEIHITLGPTGLTIYESSDIIAQFNRNGVVTTPRRVGSSSSNSYDLNGIEQVVLKNNRGNTAYFTLPSSPIDGEKYRIINAFHAQYIILQCQSSDDIIAAEDGKTQTTSGQYHRMTYDNTPSVVYVMWDGVDWITHL